MDTTLHMNDPRPSLSFCCPEKLDAMLPAEGGHYCGKCEKIVTDFSRMTNEAILRELGRNPGRQVCGRFRAVQLSRPFNDWRDKWVEYYQRAQALPKRRFFSRTLQLGLSLLILFMASCRHREEFYRTKGYVYHRPIPPQKEKHPKRKKF